MGDVSEGLDTGPWEREDDGSSRWIIQGNGFVSVSVEPPDEFTPEWFVTDGSGGALLSGDEIQALARIVRWHEEHEA